MPRLKHVSSTLSDWECAELYTLAREGWTRAELVERYGLKHKNTVSGIVRRFEQLAREAGYSFEPLVFAEEHDAVADKYEVKFRPPCHIRFD
jgi:hypothetical protein